MRKAPNLIQAKMSQYGYVVRISEYIICETEKKSQNISIYQYTQRVNKKKYKNKYIETQKR